MTALSGALFDLINMEFEEKAKLKDWQWRLLQYNNGASATMPEDSESILPVTLEHEIEQKWAEIMDLEVRISELAEKILRSPLNLASIPPSHRPFLQHLERARFKLEDDRADEALQECELAIQLLEFDDIEHQLSDRGLAWLFKAGMYEKLGDYQNARFWANQAYLYLYSPRRNDPHRMIARLIQGNSCFTNGNGTRRVVEGQNAYAEAMRWLEELTETESSNSTKAEFYRVIRQSLAQVVEEVQSLKCIPEQVLEPFPKFIESHASPPPKRKVIPFRRIPIVSDEGIPAGDEKPIWDDVTGYIEVQQVGESDLEFLFEGQPLKVELLRGSKITLQPEYNYFAVKIAGDNGDSMDQAGIEPSDFVILQQAKRPSSGDIVAVVFRDEDDRATLKRIIIRSDGVTLRPESSNPKHQPRLVSPKAFAGDSPSVQVVGIAIAVLKSQSMFVTNDQSVKAREIHFRVLVEELTAGDLTRFSKNFLWGLNQIHYKLALIVEGKGRSLLSGEAISNAWEFDIQAEKIDELAPLKLGYFRYASTPSGSLISLDKLAEPFTRLVEGILNAVYEITHPRYSKKKREIELGYQESLGQAEIKKIQAESRNLEAEAAKKEAEAEKIHTETKIMVFNALKEVVEEIGGQSPLKYSRSEMQDFIRLLTLDTDQVINGAVREKVELARLPSSQE